MKKIFKIFTILLFLAIVVGAVINAQTKKNEPKEENPTQTLVINRDAKKSDTNAIYQTMNCRTCHNYDYPTKAQPALKDCPREKMTAVHQKASEGPNIVVLDELAQRYGTVVFSHKLHAGMSEFSGGCNSCHHYNTMGPILQCIQCHETERKREDISKPDLKAAYHRQCMDCHRQWSGSNDCNSCHIPKGSKNDSLIKIQTERIAGAQHPTIIAPPKRIFETNSEKGKLVTFYHDEHVEKFGLSCKTCHKTDNCVKCHDKRNSIKNSFGSYSEPVKVSKSLEDHHKQCFACHAKDNCNKCHSNKETESFNHAKVSGWALSGAHAKLSCNKCHKQSQPEKLNNNCESCHSNFVQGKFNHKSVGLTLSDNHKDLDCDNCHKEKKFNNKPECKDCHDDKSFPKQLPGKRK